MLFELFHFKVDSGPISQKREKKNNKKLYAQNHIKEAYIVSCTSIYKGTGKTTESYPQNCGVTRKIKIKNAFIKKRRSPISLYKQN